MVQILKRIHINSKDFTPLLVQRNLRFINFRTVCYGPKKRSGSCDVCILWFFGKDKHGQAQEFFREFPLRWRFIGRHDLVRRSVVNKHLGNMQEEEHLPSLFGMGATCQFPGGQILSNSVSTSTWFFRGLFGLIILMPQIPYSNCPKNQLNNKYKLA